MIVGRRCPCVKNLRESFWRWSNPEVKEGRDAAPFGADAWCEKNCKQCNGTGMIMENLEEGTVTDAQYEALRRDFDRKIARKLA